MVLEVLPPHCGSPARTPSVSWPQTASPLSTTHLLRELYCRSGSPVRDTSHLSTRYQSLTVSCALPRSRALWNRQRPRFLPATATLAQILPHGDDRVRGRCLQPALPFQP